MRAESIIPRQHIDARRSERYEERTPYFAIQPTATSDTRNIAAMTLATCSTARRPPLFASNRIRTSQSRDLVVQRQRMLTIPRAPRRRTHDAIHGVTDL